jgi:hypothetical protein
MFHLSGKMFLPQEFVDPFADFRNTSIVFFAVVHTIIMVRVVIIGTSASVCQEENRFAQKPALTSCATLPRSFPAPEFNLFFAVDFAVADFSKRERKRRCLSHTGRSAAAEEKPANWPRPRGLRPKWAGGSERIFRSIYDYSWRLYGYAHADESKDSGN